MKFNSIYTPLDSIQLKPDPAFCSIEKTLQQLERHFVHSFWPVRLPAMHDSTSARAMLKVCILIKISLR